jgi:endonuclease/exonuclease/phosphatase family metal-dependent hydrolase
MNRRTFCALFLLGSVFAVLHPALGQNPIRTLRVLTYNIHHGEGTDGKLDLERIAKVILSVKPDLVALQEVDQTATRTGRIDQIARLAELTSLHSAYGRAMDFQGGGYGVAMLSRWPLQEVVTHALPKAPGVEPRAVLSAVVQMEDNGPKLQFLVTHVDHRGDPTQRTIQVAKIRELFPPKPEAIPALLAGDFNATPESEVIKELLSEWTDTAAGQQFFTSPSDPPIRKIDYVFARPAARWRTVETRELDEAVASDHRPVLAVLELKP